MVVLKNVETGRLIVVDNISEWEEELMRGEYEYVEEFVEDQISW